MKTNRSGQGRTEQQIERNHQILDLLVQILGVVMYFFICYQIVNYMINN